MKSVLDSRQLLAARVLANTGSFTLTGRQLSLTQSAVSHAIKTLEEEIECKLFVRTGRGVMVTPAGKHFLQYTDRILENMETARTLVSPRTTRGKERLRLGVGMRAREYILPVVQPLFHKDYPNRLVVIEPGDYRRSVELLDSALLDLSFTVRPIDRPDLDFVHLFDDELRFIVSPNHPWAQRGRAAFGDLTRDTVLLFQDFNNTAQLLAKHLNTQQISPRHGVELPDYQSIKALVHTGHAVGVLSPWLASKELKDGSLVALPMGSSPLYRQWGMAYVRQRSLAPMEERLIELCQQAVPGILSRLQGLSEEVREKKEAPVVPALAEPSLTYSGVALAAVAVVHNFLNDSMAWVNWGSIASAVS